MVLQLIVSGIRAYAPWIMLPFTITVGYIGYKLEGYVRRPRPIQPSLSVEEKRLERQLNELNDSSTTVTTHTVK